MNSISSTTPQIYSNSNISNNIQTTNQNTENLHANIDDSVSINNSSNTTQEISRQQIQQQTRTAEPQFTASTQTLPQTTEETQETQAPAQADETQETQAQPQTEETSSNEETNADNNSRPSIKEKLAELGDKALDAYFTITDSIDAFPGFIYPAVTGATAEQAEFTYKVLDKLPLKDVSSVSNIEWVPELFMSADKTAHASGVAYSALSPYIKIAEDECGDLGKWAEKVIIHETGHTRDYSEGFLSNIARETDTNPIWGAGNRVTEYAKTNPREDFAESYQYFYTEGDKLQEIAPEKYDRITEMEQPDGTLEAIVENQDAFRETGKWIGQKLSEHPYLKTGLDTASYVITGIGAVVDGVRLAHGVKEDDEAKQMAGNLGLTATAVSLAGAPIAGAAIDGANMALSRAIDKGEITPEAANYVASHTVGAPIAGAIKLGKWINSKITEIKANRTESTQPTEDSQPTSESSQTTETQPATNSQHTSEANTEENPPTVNENEETNETESTDKPKATLKSSIKALGIGIGGAIGSAAGAIGGIYAGVTAGFAIGGPAGGAVGLLIGLVLGNTTGNHLMAKLGSVIGGKIQDKVNPQPTPTEDQQTNESSNTNNTEEINS